MSEVRIAHYKAEAQEDGKIILKETAFDKGEDVIVYLIRKGIEIKELPGEVKE